MLYIVLILVLGALGLVVAALITADSLWAWISIGLSVLAGVLLVVDWLRRRSASGASSATPADDANDAGDEKTAGESAAAAQAGQPGESPEAAEHTAGAAENADAAEDETAGSEPATVDAAAGAGEGATAMLPASGALTDPDGEPAEEQTDAADVLVVSTLDAEVLVVDEHPRYHLADCAWLETRETIPLPAKEARELGFTPCALCGPDATLAAKYREERRTRK
ncbi:hypothetical protein ACFS2C_19080 [Prauserella oleivorans]|uniref:Uncharacterized protein n=1 Tax=Prauserella oleivorans TaxID=1478153 RepID=A0ABW5WCM5_9PSEU